MKVYTTLWQDIPRNEWPKQGEIFICLDPQERLGPETWSVSQFWEQDGIKDIDHCDIIGRGLFWTKEDAILFAGILEKVRTREVTLGANFTLNPGKLHDYGQLDLIISNEGELDPTKKSGSGIYGLSH